METKAQVTTNAAEKRGKMAPLYHRYSHAQREQGAYIEIDPQQRTATANWDAETGNAVPMAVWYGRTLRYAVSPCLRGDAIADLLESPDVLSLLARICDGHSIVWDASNHQGQLTHDAAAASDELQRLLDDLTSYPDNLVSAYDACDWLQDYDWAEVADMADAQIDAEAARLAHEAENECVIIDGGADAIAACLRTKRDEAN